MAQSEDQYVQPTVKVKTTKENKYHTEGTVLTVDPKIAKVLINKKFAVEHK